MESPAPVRILTVCTGNICRSPVAERLLQAGLDQVVPGGFEVTSAGTRAMVGDPMQPISADIVRTFGGNPDNFAARQLTPKILRGVDLVLTMTSGHRGEVLQLDASFLKRTFTIREFARMLNVLDQRAADSGTSGASAPVGSAPATSAPVGSASGAGASASGSSGSGSSVFGLEAHPVRDDVLAANLTFWRGLPARAASVRHLSLPADASENDIVDPYRRAPEVYRQMEDELAPAIVSILRHARLNNSPSGSRASVL